MKVIDNATVQVQVDYDEASLNRDGTPLTDLAYSNTYYQIGAAPVVAAAKTPATKATGGGHISIPLIIPAPLDARTSFNFWATATDLSGNESAKSVVFPFTVERLAPAGPVNFTIA